MKKALELNSDNFKEMVVDSDIPVLVDFWGSWCPPCKMAEPLVNELANELEGKVKVVKINVDRNPSIGAEYNVYGAPTFALFVEGKIVKTEIGSRSKKQLLDMIKN